MVQCVVVLPLFYMQILWPAGMQERSKTNHDVQQSNNQMGGNYPVGLPQQLPAVHCPVDKTQLYRNSRHIFSRQKFQGGHSPQTISAIGSGHCGGKIMRWNWAEQQKLSRYLTKYAFLRIIYSLSIFFLGCIKTPWGDAPQLWYCFQRIYRRHVRQCLLIVYDSILRSRMLNVFCVCTFVVLGWLKNPIGPIVKFRVFAPTKIGERSPKSKTCLEK